VEPLNELHAAATANGIEFWVLLSDDSTPRTALLVSAAAMGLQMPVLLDRDLMAARLLGVGRALEAILVRVPDFTIIYRGAISEGTECFLREALEAFVEGVRPRVWRTESRAGLLPQLDGAELLYSRDIAPILRTYCARCHQPGTSAPFSFSSHDDAQRRASHIRHQVLSGHMPPWQADAEYGQFTNSLELPSQARRELIAWLDAGAPRDDGPDPLALSPPSAPAVDLVDELGPPDAVITMPAQPVRATGAEPYRTFQVRAPNLSNVWLRAVALVPGDPAVVHHYALFQPLPSELVGEINLGFAFYVPGRAAQPFPPGTGMFLGASSSLLLELHYSPNGSPAVDTPKVHLWYHRERPSKRFFTFTIVNTQFEIPPGAEEYAVSAQHRFDEPVTVHSLAPHMHMRGRSMRFEAVYPDGAREVLLSVPQYHFHWQLRYELAQPKALPAGTIVEVHGTFDNSPRNLSNPDPSATVRWGQQSWEEMFMGILELSQ
jgi:hypothetical protein